MEKKINPRGTNPSNIIIFIIIIKNHSRKRALIVKGKKAARPKGEKIGHDFAQLPNSPLRKNGNFAIGIADTFKRSA